MFRIIPLDTTFFDLFERTAAIVVRAAASYADLVRDYSNRDAHIAKIRQLEHDGDEIIHRTLDRLDTSFITPFDREDIQLLVKRMDDVIDEIDAASKRLNIYKIKEPTPWLVKQTEVLSKATLLTESAIKRLRNLKKPNGLFDHLVEIHHLENLGDENNHAAVAELYENATDAILVMKWKEIYDRTEKAIDRCEDIANAIEAIHLKHA